MNDSRTVKFDFLTVFFISPQYYDLRAWLSSILPDDAMAIKTRGGGGGGGGGGYKNHDRGKLAIPKNQYALHVPWHSVEPTYCTTLSLSNVT